MTAIRHRHRIRIVSTVFALFVLTLASVAQERDRARIPDRYKWNLTDIYATNAAWRAEKDKLQAEIPQLGQFKGKLSSSAAILADALDKMNALDKELSRLYVYASLLADEDTRNAQHQGMRQEMVQLAASLAAEGSFIEPEILRFPAGTVERLLASDGRLKIYRFYLEDITRRAGHTLSDAEEKILAGMGPLSGSPANVFNILSNADFPYPTITLSDGRTAKVDQAGFNVLRALPNRADRQHAMSAFFQALGSFSRTYGTTINGEVQKVLFFSKVRKYPSALAATLDAPNIPVSVYTRLVDGVNRN
jgi:oligoendopeptidase F